MSGSPYLVSENKCQVCGRHEPMGVFCSSFGAMSLAYCDVCGGLGLEPPELVAGMVEVNGGWDAVADWLRGYPAHAIHMGLLALYEKVSRKKATDA